MKHSNHWVILVNPSKLLHTTSGQVPSLTESTSTERSPALGIPGLPLREREPSMKNSMLSPACNTCTMYCRKMGRKGKGSDVCEWVGRYRRVKIQGVYTVEQVNLALQNTCINMGTH